MEDLDVKRLENAWAKVMEIHEMLITVIHIDGRQQISEKVPPYTIQITDLRDAESIEDELRKIESSMLAKVHPLGEWPCFDLQVSMVKEAKSIIHFSIDLIIADGPSIDLLLKRLFYFYEHPGERPRKNTMAFCDYVLSMQNYQKTKSYQRSLRYWKNKFSEIPSGPRLPMLEGAVTNKTERLSGVLTNWSAIKAAAEDLSLSANMILFAAYAEVFSGWSNYEPFTLVIPSWERLPLYPEINSVVGDFTSMSWLVVAREERPFIEKVRLYQRSIQEDLSHRAVSGLKALRTFFSKNGKKQRLSFPIVFTDLSEPVCLELPKGIQLGKSLSQTPQVHVDNISSQENGRLNFHWDVTAGIFPGGMMKEMFSGYQRVLEWLAKRSNNWDEVDFSELIAAEPERYRCRSKLVCS